MDEAVFRLLNAAAENPFMGPLAVALSSRWMLALVCVPLAVFLAKSRRYREIVGITLVVVFANHFSADLLKPTFDRERPCRALSGVVTPAGCGVAKSMPSVHATNAFALALAAFGLVPLRYGLGILVLAICVALSRVVLGVHYPSDVLVGAGVGSLIGLCLLGLRRHPKLFPGALCALLFLGGARADARPSQLAEVFRSQRAGILSVEGSCGGLAFVVGARGELLFSCRRHPKNPTFDLKTEAGDRLNAQILRYDSKLRLGIAQTETALGLPVLELDGAALPADAWVLAVRFEEGETVPHIGTADRVAGHQVSVQAASSPGSPVIGANAKVLGVVVRGGTRKSRAVSTAGILAFLREASR